MPTDLNPRYTRHVKALWPPSEPDNLSGLEEAADAVRALEGSQGWSVIRKLLVNEIVTLDRQLEREDESLSHAEMSKVVGRRAACRELQDVLDAVTGEAEHRHAAQAQKHEQETAETAYQERVDHEIESLHRLHHPEAAIPVRD